MKLTRTILSVALLACVALPASAQFSGLMGGKKATANESAGDIDSNVQSFLEKSFRTEMMISKAALAITAAYASEQERAQFQAKFDEVSKQTNPKEAGAVFQSVRESTEAAMKKLAASGDLAEQTSKLSNEKQAQVAKALGNFLLGAMQAKELAPTGQNVLQAAGANPMNISKVVPVKDALPRLAGAASMAGSSLPKFVEVLRGANVKVAEVTTSSREEEIKAI